MPYVYCSQKKVLNKLSYLLGIPCRCQLFRVQQYLYQNTGLIKSDPVEYLNALFNTLNIEYSIRCLSAKR
jgi:hypothetical protein